jgi:hypothetical protein
MGNVDMHPAWRSPRSANAENLHRFIRGYYGTVAGCTQHTKKRLKYNKNSISIEITFSMSLNCSPVTYASVCRRVVFVASQQLEPIFLPG